jgi:putative hydrolase of the HAD superfamily
VFDLGGTVLEMRYDVLADIARRHGAAPPADWVARGERAARARVHQVMAEGGSNDATWRAMFHALLLVAGVPPQGLAGAFDDAAAYHRAHHLWSRVLPGMDDAVRGLAARGYRVAALSNSDGRAERVLADVGLLDAFEFVIDSQDVGLEKPDPRIFALASTRLGIAPSACAYVGDLTPVDVFGARAAGFAPVLFDPYDSYTGDEPFATAHGDAPRVREAAELRALFPGAVKAAT